MRDSLCGSLEIEKPAWVQDKSIMPIVLGEARQIDEEVFAEVTCHGAYEPKRAVPTRQWKYVRHFDDRTRPVRVNCDDGPSKKYWIEHGCHDWGAMDRLHTKG